MTAPRRWTLTLYWDTASGAGEAQHDAGDKCYHVVRDSRLQCFEYAQGYVDRAIFLITECSYHHPYKIEIIPWQVTDDT